VPCTPLAAAAAAAGLLSHLETERERGLRTVSQATAQMEARGGGEKFEIDATASSFPFSFVFSSFF
jgi:hypothetical protein